MSTPKKQTPERLEEIHKIRNCVPFVDTKAGIPETQQGFDDLFARIAAQDDELLSFKFGSGGTICPCLLTTPCQENCTCVKPFMSHGCNRCATYGSKEQRIARAKWIAEVIDNAISKIRADREIPLQGQLDQKIKDAAEPKLQEEITKPAIVDASWIQPGPKTEDPHEDWRFTPIFILFAILALVIAFLLYISIKGN